MPKVRLCIEEVTYRQLDLDYDELVELAGTELAGIPPLSELSRGDSTKLVLSGPMPAALEEVLATSMETNSGEPVLTEIRLL